MKIRKGDTVEVISGDDKGARGQVHTMSPVSGKVVVSGVNIAIKHQKPTGRANKQAGRIEVEAPLRLSKVALVCPHCDRPTRVGYQLGEDGTKSRVCRRCQEVID